MKHKKVKNCKVKKTIVESDFSLFFNYFYNITNYYNLLLYRKSIFLVCIYINKKYKYYNDIKYINDICNK